MVDTPCRAGRKRSPYDCPAYIRLHGRGWLEGSAPQAPDPPSRCASVNRLSTTTPAPVAADKPRRGRTASTRSPVALCIGQPLEHHYPGTRRRGQTPSRSGAAPYRHPFRRAAALSNLRGLNQRVGTDGCRPTGRGPVPPSFSPGRGAQQLAWAQSARGHRWLPTDQSVSARERGATRAARIRAAIPAPLPHSLYGTGPAVG